MARNQRFLMLIVLLVAFLLPLLSGCYSMAGRSTGQVIDDATISTTVKAKLFDAEDLNGFSISVETFEGVVTLTGAVNTYEQKRLAEELARSVRGVRGVNNLLVNK